MKNIFNQLTKIDKNFLTILLLATIVPIAYSSLRLIWITDNGSGTYAMTSFNSYIQAMIEVFTAFLIIPMFTYREEDYENKCNSIFLSVIIATIIMFLFLLVLTIPMLNSMIEMNPNENKKDLFYYLIITAASDSISIIETYLICEIALGKNTIKGLVFISANLLIKIIIDILMISNISIIEFTIINVALSSLITSLIISFILIIIYFLKQKKNSNIKSIVLSDLMTFYKKGFMPGVDKLIGNFFYAFVTLSIVNNLGETGWNSWHLGMFIYWHIIFKITYIFKYSLLSESINNKEIDKNKLMILYSLIDIIIFIVLGPILSLTILRNVVDNEEWLRLTTTTSLIMIPFMLFMSISDKFKVFFLTENKFKFTLINTTISNFLIEFPIFILLLLGMEFNYLENFIIWMLTITSTFLINIIFYLTFIKKNENNNKI